MIFHREVFRGNYWYKYSADLPINNVLVTLPEVVLGTRELNLTLAMSYNTIMTGAGTKSYDLMFI
jgi:hypothetical protein